MGELPRPGMTRLVLTGPDEIQMYDVWPEQGRVSLTARADIVNTHGVVAAADCLYCAARGEVLRLDRELQIIARRSFSDVGGIATLTSGDAVVSVDGTLLVLDRSLEEIGRYPLTTAGKNAHDLLVRGAYVYVLDNIIYPALIWILNLSDPENPVVVHEGKVVDIYVHLVAQLVPPGAGVWLVFASGSAQTGGWQSLHAFSAFDGRLLREPAKLALHLHPWSDPSYEPKSSPSAPEVTLASLRGVSTSEDRPGLSVAAVDSSGSGWAILSDEHRGLYTAELIVERDVLVARHLSPAPGARSIAAGELHVYTLACAREHSRGELRIHSKDSGFVQYHDTVWPAKPQRKEPSYWRPSMLLVNSAVSVW